MASAKFPKGSDEFEMFTDYWNLCQKYWIPENNEEYWDTALAEIDAFAKKYGMTKFARGLGSALVNGLEERAKK